MRLIALVVATLVALAGAGWFARTATAAPQSIAVEMINFGFSPAAANVHAGDTVIWTNHDTAPHDVTVTRGLVAIHSPLLDTGQTWSYTFTTPGTYDYICSIHPDMHAVVTVAAAPVQRQRPASVVTVPAVIAPSTGATVAHRASRPAPVTRSSRPAPSPATSSSSAAAAAVAQAPPAATTVSHTLKPLLVVAGLVAAIATFCLLVLASRPDEDLAD
jgi:plastocyanin